MSGSVGFALEAARVGPIVRIPPDMKKRAAGDGLLQQRDNPPRPIAGLPCYSPSQAFCQARRAAGLSAAASL